MTEHLLKQVHQSERLLSFKPHTVTAGLDLSPQNSLHAGKAFTLLNRNSHAAVVGSSTGGTEVQLFVCFRSWTTYAKYNLNDVANKMNKNHHASLFKMSFYSNAATAVRNNILII